VVSHSLALFVEDGTPHFIARGMVLPRMRYDRAKPVQPSCNSARCAGSLETLGIKKTPHAARRSAALNISNETTMRCYNRSAYHSSVSISVPDEPASPYFSRDPSTSE
jgi:hypothetical protein